MPMHNRLKTILAAKQQEIVHSYAHASPTLLATLHDGHLSADLPSKDFAAALLRTQQQQISVIAEIKRRSPSKGELATIPDPCELADCYVDGGADAISVLTDKPFFAGSLSDLQNVATHLRDSYVPVLRKDFILDPIQIAEAKLARADAVLLIVKILTEIQLQQLLRYAQQLNLQAIVEVYDVEEIAMATQSGAVMIAINNRDLNHFSVQPNHGLDLMHALPHGVIKIAASGFEDAALVHQYQQAGFDAVLIGEALVRHPMPKHFIRTMKGDLTYAQHE